MTIYNVSIFTNIVTQVVGGGDRRGKGRESGGGGGEPVDKHLRLLFHPLVIILQIICQ